MFRNYRDKVPKHLVPAIITFIERHQMTNSETRRKFLQTAAVAAAATTLPVVPAIAGEPDPIFAAIGARKAAAAEWLRMVNISSDIRTDAEAWRAADNATGACHARLAETQIALLTTRPTTVAGAAAVLVYVASFWVDGNDSTDKGIPIYETVGKGKVDNAGEGFLPMIAGVFRDLAASHV